MTPSAQWSAWAVVLLKSMIVQAFTERHILDIAQNLDDHVYVQGRADGCCASVSDKESKRGSANEYNFRQYIL